MEIILRYAGTAFPAFAISGLYNKGTSSFEKKVLAIAKKSKNCSVNFKKKIF